MIGIEPKFKYVEFFKLIATILFYLLPIIFYYLLNNFGPEIHSINRFGYILITIFTITQFIIFPTVFFIGFFLQKYFRNLDLYKYIFIFNRNFLVILFCAVIIPDIIGYDFQYIVLIIFVLLTSLSYVKKSLNGLQKITGIVLTLGLHISIYYIIICTIVPGCVGKEWI